MIAGKYTVRSSLGNGGAVMTYHCVSQQGQEVAVKLYDPAVASHSTVMKSLEQAYAATNALPQNSAAPIIDAGYDQTTIAPFSVTELIRLPSLQGQQRRLPPEEVVALLNGLARSLDLAHLRNVVHGAIKPTNVFAGPSCNPIIVTDFAANLPKAAVPTQEGFVLSAPWIAPEQAQSGSVTPSADVFSVGLLVFYALTGRTYWRSCQAQTFDLNGWQQELAATRVPCSQRAAELGVPLSPSLDIVIWKALSNDPQERFKSVGEFANVLEDSLRQTQQVGTAATMALPMVGDAPSPLPAGMRNPEAPRPAAGAPAMHGGAATLALPMEAFMGPGGMPPMADVLGSPQLGHGGPGGQPGAMPTQAMSVSQLQAHAAAMQGGGGHDLHQFRGSNGPGNDPRTGNGDGGYGNGVVNGGAQYMGSAPQPAQSSSGAYGYAPGRDQGYPPPPNAHTMTQVGGANNKGGKVVPIVIGFTAVALIGVLGTLVFLKLRSDAGPDNDAPVKVDSSARPSGEPAKPPPGPEPTSTNNSNASSTGSAATPTATPIELKVVCRPVACEEIKVDGAAIDMKQPLKLAPGSHEIEISKSGYVGQTEKVELKEGSAPVTKTFQLQAEKAATPPPPPPSTGRPPPPNNNAKPCKKGGFIKKC